MTDKPSDEFMEAAALISMEWFDITPIAKALAEQYQKGFDAGKKQAPLDAEQLKAEFERGRESYRDELLATMIPKIASIGHLDKIAAQPVTHNDNHKPIVKIPIASSIEETKPKPKPAPAIKPAPQEVINREVAKRQEPPRAAVEPFKPRVPDPGKKLGPPARAVHGEMFKHGGREVMLHPREYLLTSKLYDVKGQHIGTQFLAQNALGIKDRGGDSESLIRDLVSVINPKIEGMGLKIGFYKGAGFIMQDAG